MTALWKVTRHYGMLPDPLENYRTLGKVSEKLLDTPESLDTLKSFRTLCKLFRYSGKFPGTPERFRTIRKCFPTLKLKYYATPECRFLHAAFHQINGQNNDRFKAK